jgi:hypothetical protein
MGWTVWKIRRGSRNSGFHVGETYERGLSDKWYMGFSDGEWDPAGDNPFAGFVDSCFRRKMPDGDFSWWHQRGGPTLNHDRGPGGPPLTFWREEDHHQGSGATGNVLSECEGRVLRDNHGRGTGTLRRVESPPHENSR